MNTSQTTRRQARNDDQPAPEKLRVLLEFDSGEEYVRWIQDLQDAALLRRWIEGERLRTRDPVGREEDFEEG